MIFNPVIFGAGGSSDILYIYVAQLPDKRDYYTGENFDPTGMIVKGVKQDLTEVVIPNDQLSYLPPMPLTLDSELLRLLYTDHGQTYGTTLALNILIGIWIAQEIGRILIIHNDLEIPDIVDEGIVIADEPIRINANENVSRILIVHDNISAVEFTESLAPRAPIARAIFEFDISGNAYVTHNSNNQIVLQDTYTYGSHAIVIDSGNACASTVVTSDKSSVQEVAVYEL